MNKGQLFEQSEKLADSRLYSDLAKSNVILELANNVVQPVMKAVAKGAPKKYSRWKAQQESASQSKPDLVAMQRSKNWHSYKKGKRHEQNRT